ncbi:hypothetical protein Hanom_Chr07g00583271 [Helianthus anomalus]
MLAILRVASRKRDRIGQEFYGCPLWPIWRMSLRTHLWPTIQVMKVFRWKI